MRFRSAPPKWRGGNSNRFPSLLLPRLALIVGALLLCLFLLFATTTTTTTTTTPSSSSLSAPSLRTTTSSSPPTRAPRLQRYPWATVYPRSVPSVTLQKKERGPSWPFVTGDGFRFMANVIIDETIGMVGIPIVVPALVQQACRDVVRAHLHDLPNSSSSSGEEQTKQEVASSSPSSSPPRPVVVFVQTHYLDTFLASWAAHAPKEASSSSSSSSPPTTTATTTADASSTREAKVKQCRIVLVTHNSDYSAPYEAGDTLLKPGRQQQPQQKTSNNDEDVLPPTRYHHHREWILNNPLQFQKWFAQNAAMRHPRLVPIPIGIENRYNRYGPHFNVYREIASSARPLRERSRWLLVSFSLKTNKKERVGALNAVSTPVWMEKNESFRTLLTKFPAKGGADRKKPTAEVHRETLKLFLSAAAQHKFVLAPRGHGLDTHRLWEALYMGCIPIVRRSTMDPLLEALPVLLVDDYREVTPDRLAVAAVELGPRFEDPERMKWLTMEGWTAEIRSALALK